MTRSRKWVTLSILGSLMVVGAIVAVAVFGATGMVSAATATAEELQTRVQAATPPGLLNVGYLSSGRGWDPVGSLGIGGSIDYAQLLADALGISVDELQSAYETAREAAIAEAVEQGLITQEQADEMLVWDGVGRHGFGLLGRLGRGPKGVLGATIDEEALLADALGISVADLHAAREAANEAAVVQAVEEGILTQEQADEMLARRALRDYLERDVLLAKALGMSVEELRAAYADGQSLSDLMAERGLDAAAVREGLQQAYADALAQAVSDGVITQEQADAMQAAPGCGGMLMGPGRGGLRGRGRGGFRGTIPGGENTDDTSDTWFRSPGRSRFQSGSDL